ncbi:hypothetical protein NN561_016296 [Cricetulus griseus]
MGTWIWASAGSEPGFSLVPGATLGHRPAAPAQHRFALTSVSRALTIAPARRPYKETFPNIPIDRLAPCSPQRAPHRAPPLTPAPPPLAAPHSRRIGGRSDPQNSSG